MEREKSKKCVLLVGASPDPSRYAFAAAKIFQ
ncbi:MAG: putative CoA-binding protein [Algoriphagus sp.]|jgi:predicted CoA-binding protein